MSDSDRDEKMVDDGDDEHGRSLTARIVVFYKKNISTHLPHGVSFITVHYIYFIVTCLISSLVFWGSSTPARSVRYIDSLFFAVSAMTEAGLNTVNLSSLNTWQQIILFLLIMMGSAIFVSSAVIHVRKRAFEDKLQELADRHERRLLRPRSLSIAKRVRRLSASSSHRREAEVASGAVRGRAIQDPPSDTPYQPSRIVGGSRPVMGITVPGASSSPLDDTDDKVQVPPPSAATHISFAPSTNLPPSQQRRRDKFSLNTGVGVHRANAHPRHAKPHIELPDTIQENEKLDQGNASSELNKYVKSKNGYVGRNSQFHRLTEKERRKLGGIEYDALCLLSYVVPLYYVLFQLIGAVGCGAWITINRPEIARENGLNPFWTGAFFAISAFNNSGMALLDANATALQTSYYMLLTMSLLILAGNTCFPVFLRLIFWTMKVLIPKDVKSPRLHRWRNVIAFVLDHPRRVYTNLFPASSTWWLVASLVALNGIDWAAFEVLNIGNPALDSIAPRFRALDGLFQAFAVRAGGFYVVAISALYPGTQVLYVLMMYLSAFPVTMTIRNTNVYEERSLGVFSDEPAGPEEAPPKLKRAKTVDFMRNLAMSHGGGGSGGHGWGQSTYVRQQLRGQLGHDLWWLGLAVFFITIIETSSFHRDPVDFSIFNILFEVVSAYGTVGISIGVPWAAYSFSGAWHTGSKLILCAVMLRGRHRGLPVAIDRAILLPHSSLAWAEEEDGRLRRAKTEVVATAVDGYSVQSRRGSVYTRRSDDIV